MRTGEFGTKISNEIFPTEPIICVKEKKQSLLFFPKFFATQKTFLNANYVASPKFHFFLQKYGATKSQEDK